jgi:hypothetical protein
MPRLEEYGQAARAAAEILRTCRVPVSKAENPLDDGDFVLLSERFNRSLVRAVGADEDLAMAQAAEDLDVDWAGLSEAQRARAVTRAKSRILAVPAAVTAAIVLASGSRVSRVASETRRRSIKSFGLAAPLEIGGSDVEALSAILEAQGLSVLEEYDRRAELLGSIVSAEVGSGIAAGASSTDIAANIGRSVSTWHSRRSAAYWYVTAMAAIGFARTAAQLNVFSDAGVVTYEFVAVMDERTTEICQYMNGKTLSVASGVRQLRSVAASNSLDEIKSVRPWVGRGRAENGDDTLYYQRGDARIVVANIGPDGSFTQGMSSEQLEEAGLLVPPLHGRCRSWIIVH